MRGKKVLSSVMQIWKFIFYTYNLKKVYFEIIRENIQDIHNLTITNGGIMEIFLFNLASSHLTFWLHTLCLINSQDLWEFFLHLLLCLIHLSFTFNASLSAAATADANYERMVLRFFYINRITFYDLLVLIPYNNASREFFTFTAISFW